MKGTVTEKILNSHLLNNESTKSDISTNDQLEIFPDDTLIQDASGILIWLEVEAFNLSKVKTRPLTFIDHNTIQLGVENGDDHMFLESVTSKYGTVLSKAGNGICHSVYLENYASPGKMVLGGDSHTPNAGGMGMIGIGVGGLNIAKCIAGKPYHLKTPEVIGVELKGKLSDWVSAKDVVLKVLQEIGFKNKYKVLEYYGEGVSSLSVDERSTITNMGAESGVTFSIFPSDEKTLEYLKAVGREEEYVPLSKDKNAEYFDILKIDLSQVEPMLVLPPKVGQKGLGEPSPIDNSVGVKVDQVCIGSCTNSSYHDLKIVAAILKDKNVAENVELVITPGSRSLRNKLITEGVFEILSKAGARITEEVCGPCVGQGYAPSSGGIRLATFNRNFIGRSGTKDAYVYLCSPETAALAALSGYIKDPRDLTDEIDFHRYSLTNVDISESLLKNPGQPNINLKVKKSRNISDLPSFNKFKEKLKARVALKLGDRITTDDIAPAGTWLKVRSNLEEYSKATYSGVTKDFYTKSKNNIEDGYVNVVFAGDGYGEGSAKEHAALCPMYLGVRMIFAKSFQRIHKDNLINFGIIPVEIDQNAYDFVNEGDEIEIIVDIKSQTGLHIIVNNLTTCNHIRMNLNFTTNQMSLIKNGGVFNE